MNRIVKHLVGTAAALGVAGVLLAAGPVRAASGPGSAQETPQVTVTIPGRVGIVLSNHPTTLQPGNDYPPENTGFPYWVVSPQFTIKVFSNRTGPNFKVTVDASTPSWPDGLAKTDLHVVTWGAPASTYAGQGTPSDPANGDNTLPTGWVALGATAVDIVGSRGRTTGWEPYNAKLALKLEGNEAEAAAFPVTFTYTISTI